MDILHLVEIDNTRSMKDNKKKIEKYADMCRNDIRKTFTTNT